MVNFSDLPVWYEALDKWYGEMYLKFENLLPQDREDCQQFAAEANLSICPYCLGPCGRCTQKYDDDPYPCDPCPQDAHYGITECTYCPFSLFNTLLELRAEKG